MQRREFLKTGSALSLAVAAAPSLLWAADVPKTAARIVVVGGGYGGAIAAKYLKRLDPKLEVTLIEKESNYISCPLSNEILSGERKLNDLTFDYNGLAAHGIQIVHDEIVAIDPVKQSLQGKGGTNYAYDQLILSPGVDYRWEAIEGYSAELAETQIPHAWKAGAQTELLRKQIVAMKDGGVVLISAPPNPFRCPPGPYERAAQIAHYLHQQKPKSKVILLDAKDAFSKQGLFTAGWKQNYGEMIEWVGAAGGGKVSAVKAESKTLIGEMEEYRGEVVNIIPPQKAAPIAFAADLTDASGWCPVHPQSFESTRHPNIYVIGDAAQAGEMPKSGYAANSQGKVCAAAIVAKLSGVELPEPSYVNTCYSLIAPNYGISVAGVYGLKEGKIVAIEGSGGVSPAEATPQLRAREAQFAHGWFKNITQDMFS